MSVLIACIQICPDMFCGIFTELYREKLSSMGKVDLPPNYNKQLTPLHKKFVTEIRSPIGLLK